MALITLYETEQDYKKAESKIHKIGKEILKQSIETQIKREEIVYKALKLNINPYSITKDDLITIKNAIYRIEDNKVSIDDCMKILVEHFTNLIVKSTGNESEDRENLKSIIDEFTLMKQDGKKYLETYFSSFNNLGASFDADNLFKVIGSFDSFLKDFNITEDKNINAQIDYSVVKKILDKYTNAKKDIIGSIGEGLGVYYSDLGADIVTTYTTSGWGTKSYKDKIKSTEKATDFKYSPSISTSKIKLKEEQFHKNNRDLLEKLKNQISEKVDVESENFFLRTTIDLKADIIYVINLGVEEEFFYFGISNKTAYSDSDILKVQTTSFSGLAGNIYKVSKYNGEEFVISPESQTISGLLKGLAISYVYNKWDDDEFNKFKDIVNFVVDYYGYVWLTGGIEDKSHADFFSVYAHGGFYFMPMSYVLKLIWSCVQADEINSKTHFFDPLAINHYLLSGTNSDEKKYRPMLRNSYNKEEYENRIKEIQTVLNEMYKKDKENRNKKNQTSESFKLKTQLQEELKFVKDFMESIKKRKGYYTRKMNNETDYDIDGIISRISKPEAPIRITGVNYGIITSI